MFFKSKSKNNETSSWQQNEVVKNSHSIIADNLHIVGDIRFSGTLRIDGKVDGKIELLKKQQGTLILSTTAQVNGPVSTTNLISNGVINGRVHVDDKLECRNNSRINGQVTYGSLHLDSGAIIEGRCSKKPTNTSKSSPRKSLEVEMSSFLKTR
jgi:cytoskeletal protein CcmA (bactofilin family)|tara:strand:+ start:2353 stop:2814 length:462 start_codon:yes stop_codon:yes gene_type:complete